METNHLARAEEYYKFIGEKKPDEFKKYLCSDVEFCGPLAILKGKDAVVQATTNFMNAFEFLRIRAKFSSGDQAMIIYDVDMPGITTISGASLMTFQNGLIVRIELFYDGSRFLEKKQEIFT